MKKHPYFFLLLLICSFSCKRDPAPAPDFIFPLPQVLSDYGYFVKGTYWIYQDSTTKVIDSVYVINNEQGTKETSPQRGSPYNGYFGYYDVYIQSSFEGMQYHEWVNTETSSGGHTVIWEDKSNGSGSVGQTFLMTDYFVPGQTFLTGGYTTVVYENKFDSLKILNINFKNVIVFHDGNNATQNNSPTNFYLSKKIGVIRKEIFASNKVWNLIRYHIQ